jgi:microcystin-dependent protein
LDVGDSITISGAGNAAFNGTWAVVSIISSTSFTFSTVSSGTISSVAGGTITVAITNGVSGATLGASGGLSTQTLTIGQIPAHTHTVALEVVDNTAQDGGNNVTVGGTTTSSSTGGSGPHNNVQPTFVLNYVIKL